MFALQYDWRYADVFLFVLAFAAAFSSFYCATFKSEGSGNLGYRVLSAIGGLGWTVIGMRLWLLETPVPIQPPMLIGLSMVAIAAALREISNVLPKIFKSVKRCEQEVKEYKAGIAKNVVDNDANVDAHIENMIDRRRQSTEAFVKAQQAAEVAEVVAVAVAEAVEEVEAAAVAAVAKKLNS